MQDPDWVYLCNLYLLCRTKVYDKILALLIFSLVHSWWRTERELSALGTPFTFLVTLLHNMSSHLVYMSREASHTRAVFLHKWEKWLVVSHATVQEQPPTMDHNPTVVKQINMGRISLGPTYLMWYPPSGILGVFCLSYKYKACMMSWSIFYFHCCIMGLWEILLPWLVFLLSLTKNTCLYHLAEGMLFEYFL